MIQFYKPIVAFLPSRFVRHITIKYGKFKSTMNILLALTGFQISDEVMRCSFNCILRIYICLPPRFNLWGGTLRKVKFNCIVFLRILIKNPNLILVSGNPLKVCIRDDLCQAVLPRPRLFYSWQCQETMPMT